ncbi:glycosyltransferase 87 family protein [Nakamurella endophytica]|uniref:glycosyltransferase 87 family protein n=1 Tax=Nakamurella endophytica TaxID=1748367 RepID=UPI00166DA87F|nr:glycosyltransferase 87 family protein [Nakamurella endophytica]
MAVGVRIPFLPEISGDYTAFVSRWYDWIASHGHLAALRDPTFANYNPPYLYLLALVGYLPVPKLLAVKSISIVFDVVLALVASRFAARRSPGWAPLVAAAVVLLLPTVVVNGAGWGQCDSIYASCTIAALLLAVRRRPVWAGLLFGIAVAFKLQAVFAAPMLLLVVLAHRERIRSVAGAAGAAVAGFVALWVPALLAGAPLSVLLAVYPNQVTGGGVGGGGRGVGGAVASAPYTYNAPNFYQWLPAGAPTVWTWSGYLLVVLSVIAVAALVLPHPDRSATDVLLLAAAALAVAVPFFLPSMHERYFFLADVLTVVAAVRNRWMWPVAAAVQLASLAAYAPFLWHTTPIPLAAAAAVEAAALAGSLVVLGLRLRLPPTGRRVPDGARTAGPAPEAPARTAGVAVAAGGTEPV